MTLADVLAGRSPWHVEVGDVLDVLRTMPDGCVQCVVTSPPYWGLRDYGTAEWAGGDGSDCDHLAPKKGGNGPASALQVMVKRVDFESGGQYAHACPKCGARRIDSQLGFEPTIEEYVAKMVEVFHDVRRVLRDDGTCWVNLGDSYSTGASGDKSDALHDHGGSVRGLRKIAPVVGWKTKNLLGIPWRVALALQADGWYLRSDIIWAKPNPMPESVTDRPTKSHEYVFLLTKRARYFYDADAVREAQVSNYPSSEILRGQSWNKHDSDLGRGAAPSTKLRDGRDASHVTHPNGRNLRSVWSIPTQPWPDAHFATYPEKLVEPCIKAGTSQKGRCPECSAPWRRIVEKERRATRPGIETKLALANGSVLFKDSDKKGRYKADADIVGNRDQYRHVTETRTLGWEPGCECISLADTGVPCIVLDPFSGSGTTGVVARKLGRAYVGIELSPEYVEMSRRRIGSVDPLGDNHKLPTKPGLPPDAPLFGERVEKVRI